MKTRAILIVCVSALALIGIGMAARKVTPSHGKTAGRQSTLIPANRLAAGETTPGGSVAGTRGGGGDGGPAVRDQALFRSGVGHAMSHDRLDAESTENGAPSGTVAHDGRRGLRNNKPTSETASFSGREQIQKRIAERHREQIQEINAEFFEKNSLTEKQREAIVNKYIESRVLGDELFRQGVDSKEAVKRTLANTRVQMEELGHLLGDELYQAWAYYSATIPQRKLADDLTRQFDGSGSGMTGEQRDRLIDIFHDNHVNYHPEILPISPATKSLMNTTFTRAQEQVMREAESVLSPQQMVVMKQYWSEIINQTQ